MRRTATLRRIPWSEPLREFFRLAAADWAPPVEATSTLNASGDVLTIKATFTQPDGTVAKLKTRCERGSDGDWYATDEHLDVTLFAGGAR
jgi:hypothetical protein